MKAAAKKKHVSYLDIFHQRLRRRLLRRILRRMVMTSMDDDYSFVVVYSHRYRHRH